MRAGSLRHALTVQQPTETRDATGDVIETWADYCARRAAYEVMGGKEAMAAGLQEQAELRYRVTLRRDPVTAAIVPKMRALLDGRVLDIEQAFDPNGMKRDIHLICRAVIE